MAGILAPVVFVSVFTVAGALRPGYHPVSMFVSELSLGPGGWVQRLNFAVTGSLIAVFGWSTVPLLRRSSGRVGPSSITFMVLGTCLALSGVANTDPSAMFSQTTTHGVVHGILGAVVFLSLPISCLQVAAELRRRELRATMRRVTVAVGVAMFALIVVLKVSELPTTFLFAWRGLVQRIILIGYFVWLLGFATALRSYARRRPVAQE